MILKQVIVRADSSVNIGRGHIMRCLTLARELTGLGCTVTFIARTHKGNCNYLVEKEGFTLLELPGYSNESFAAANCYEKWLGVSQEEDAKACIELVNDSNKFDICIVDHYALDSTWHRLAKRFSKKILVIDDLANRNYLCDYLLDQTYGRGPKLYSRYVPEKCLLLLGGDYMLLRPEFHRLRLKAIEKRNNSSNTQYILVSVGGSDEANVTETILYGLIPVLASFSSVHLDVVMTAVSPHLSKIKTIADSHSRMHLHIDVENIADLMLKADLSIGACGTTSWERCCLGLPTVTLTVADNQVAITESLAKHGAIISLGSASDITARDITNEVESVIKDHEKYKALVEKCFSVCDGLGVQKVGEILKQGWESE